MPGEGRLLTVGPDDLRGAPPIMPVHIELAGLSVEEAFELRLLARDGELRVQVDGEAEPRLVRGLWADPHDPARLTLFLS